jgi:glycosyltransferase involved in cell wall biosynthesis
MNNQGRVLVDHTHCGRHVTGLERITLELFSQAALAPIRVEIAKSSGVADMIFKQTVALPFALARDSRAILLCPGFPPSITASLFGERCLPYIHDLFLITRPEDLNPRAKLYMAPSFRVAIKKLPRFLVNSETTCDELRGFCRSDAQIQLYRPNVRNVFGLDADGRGELRTTPGALKLIALGTIEPRKNLLAAGAIVTALRARGFPDATLDLVGRAGWGDDAAKLAATPGVTIHGYQPLERVRELLQSADALISTSHDEGLGLPLLEAQYAGLPVFAPDKPVFREVLGESGLFFDASNANDAADRIAALVSRPEWRAVGRKAALDNLDRWTSLAERDHIEVLRLIARLANGGAA